MELKAAFFLSLSKEVKEEKIVAHAFNNIDKSWESFREGRDKQQKRQSGFLHGSSIASGMK
jgi:hypothetical protein